MRKIKKILASVLLASTIFFSSGSVVHAGYWTETFASLSMKQGMEEAFEALWAMILKTLKQEAIKTIKEQVEKMVNGTTGENQIIMDYEEFIYEANQDEIEEFLSDFFASIQEGVSPGEREMLRNIEQSLEARIRPDVKYTSILNEIVQSPEPIDDLFDQTVGGGSKALMNMAVSEYSNPFNAYLNSLEELENKIEQVEEAAKTEAVAGLGFKTYTEGNRVMPGSIYQHVIATAEAAPIEMITNATKWQEVLASFVTSLVGSAMKNGISTVSSPGESDERSTNRSHRDGFPGIQNDIYSGL